MEPIEIRQSLNYAVYIEHARSLKLVADESIKAFYNIAYEPMDENIRLKQLGFARSALMLYAVTIELTLKAVALYHERDNIVSGEIKTFKDFIKKCKTGKSTGHEFQHLIDQYKINLTNRELKIVNNLQDYAIWAGRFPFPIKEIDIVLMENNKAGEGSSIGKIYIEEIDSLIENQFKKLTPLYPL